MDKLFEIRSLDCSYEKDSPDARVVLRIASLDIPRGRQVFIVGESGIGKSTILEVLGMMNNTVAPREGTVFNFYEEDGTKVKVMDLWDSDSDLALSEFRLRHFNFIFQNTNLMSNFTAYENIAITRMLQGYSREESFTKAREVLRDLGLDSLGEERMTTELSGGQRQRLAFARAILPDFTVLFGDEPTGNLDSGNAMNAMKVLSDKLSRMKGSSAVIVTHDMHLASTFGDIVIKLRRVPTGKNDADGQPLTMGMLDSASIFTPSPDRKEWSNATVTIPSQEFEQYLKSKE